MDSKMSFHRKYTENNPYLENSWVRVIDIYQWNNKQNVPQHILHFRSCVK